MKIKIDEFCTQIILLMSTLILSMSGVIGMQLAKYFLYVIVAFSFIKVIFLKMSLEQLVHLGIIALFSMVNLLLNGGNFSSFLVFSSSLIFVVSVFKTGISKTTWKMIKVCTYIVSFSFILMYLFSPNYSVRDQLTLYFDNPNMTGIALSAPAIMLLLMIVDSKKKDHKILNSILFAMIMYLTYLTQNRGSIISVIVLLIFLLFAMHPKKKRKMHVTWLYNLFKFTPILVMFLYLGLFFALPKDIEILGKPLFSGREEAWIIAIESLIESPFSHLTFEEGTLNLFLEGVARYGILAMAGYFMLLNSFRKSKKEISQMSVLCYLAYVAFHCCLIQQSFESTMITGSYTVYIWSYMLLGIASMKISDTSDKESSPGLKGEVAV